MSRIVRAIRVSLNSPTTIAAIYRRLVSVSKKATCPRRKTLGAIARCRRLTTWMVGHRRPTTRRIGPRVPRRRAITRGPTKMSVRGASIPRTRPSAAMMSSLLRRERARKRACSERGVHKGAPKLQLKSHLQSREDRTTPIRIGIWARRRDIHKRSWMWRLRRIMVSRCSLRTRCSRDRIESEPRVLPSMSMVVRGSDIWCGTQRERKTRIIDSLKLRFLFQN